ncbi:MAG: methylmalonyl Co-A mutase-associated GTPase MeaB [Acidimicrobiales bacterium]
MSRSEAAGDQPPPAGRQAPSEAAGDQPPPAGDRRPPPAGRSASPETLVERAAQGDRGALARLLSLVERGGFQAREVGRLAYPRGGRAHTIGITGPPGAGKSTLADGLIARARAEGREVGVLAVDPSSPFSGGALLGDRVRMQGHALDDGVFIRSMATRGHLGGLALAVPEAIRVLDASGLDPVLVETVGVGQVEVEVAGAADTTLVVVTPGSGDSVQANKAGLLEIADVFVLNKADRPDTRDARRDLRLMLGLSELGEWEPPIVETVASTGQGVDEAWAAIGRHREFLEAEGRLAARRAARLEHEVVGIVTRRLERRAHRILSGPELDPVRDDLAARRLDPYQAAERILDRLAASSSLSVK